jgi:hypothetical protein
VSSSAQGGAVKDREILLRAPASELKGTTRRAMTDEQKNRWEGLEKAVRALERARLEAVGIRGSVDRAMRLAALDASLVRVEAEKRHLRRAIRASSTVTFPRSG